MAVVMDYYNGKTHIKIDDESCVRTKEDIDKILKRVGNIYIDFLTKVSKNTKIAEEEKQF